MPKKTILHVIPRFTTGGAEQLVLSYAKHFSREYNVAVASVVGGGELEAAFKKLKIKLFVAPEKKLSATFKTKKAILKFAKEVKPDIIHSHVFSGDIIGNFLKKNLPKVKWVSTQHNVHLAHTALRLQIVKKALQRADKVVAVSIAVAETCSKVFKVPAKKQVLITNGILLDRFINISTRQLLNTDTIHLAITGRLEKQKGHDLLFKALSMISDMPWQLHIFGEGSAKKSLSELAKTLGIDQSITWHGVLPNLEKAYETVDVVVQPSRYEGMSLSVMEAMAAGRLLIVSHTAGAGLVQNRKTGLVVPVEDIKALAEAILYAYENRPDAIRMAESGRAYAKKHFSITEHFAKLGKLYASL